MSHRGFVAEVVGGHDLNVASRTGEDGSVEVSPDASESVDAYPRGHAAFFPVPLPVEWMPRP
jgi:hypothetical protein